MLKFVCIIVNLLISFSLFSQVHISEYSASNLNSFYDSFSKTEDWVELHNLSDEAIDIGGWYLSDKNSKPEKWEIPAETIIEANGFLVFWCSGRDTVVNNIITENKNEYHTNFKLTQTKKTDSLLFTNANKNNIDAIALNLTLVEHARHRAIDDFDTWVITTKPTLGTGHTGGEEYDYYTKTPSFDVEAGFYEDEQTVTITNNEPNNTVLRYTIDGNDPTTDSPIYTEPLNIKETTVVKAKAFSTVTKILPGKIEFATYFINETFTLPVFSVAAKDVLELAGGEGDLIPIGSLEYFDNSKERVATSYGSLNKHGQDSWVLPHRSIDWISRDEMGYSKAVDAPLFSYSKRDEYQKFMFRNSGDDNYPALPDEDHQGSTHIRDEYVQTLAQQGDMNLDLRAVERVILFLNGQYWGLYGMRERAVDHDYTDEYYDQGKYDLQYLSTWGATEIEYGGRKAKQDWESIRDFVLDNDMSDKDNYQIAEDSINMVSLIDYMVMNLAVVASDWLNYNTGWWRGLNEKGDHKKWGYILWDLDATFDYYINYTEIPNTQPDAKPCDLEVISEFMDEFFTGYDYGYAYYVEPYVYYGDTIYFGDDCNTIENGTSPYESSDSLYTLTVYFDQYCCENTWDGTCQQLYDDLKAGISFVKPPAEDVGKHEKIFLKLLEESETFEQLYYNRYADLMNTVFSCENMDTTLNSMLAVIEPEMPRQIERWGGTLNEWKANVDTLKDFISERCELLDDGMYECYEDLTEMHNIVLLTEPEGIAEIDFNTLDIEAFPWSGNYFGGLENKIKSKPFDDNLHAFSHWKNTNTNNVIGDSLERKTTITLIEPDTLIAVYDMITSVNEINTNHKFNVYPNPAKNFILLDFNLTKRANVHISLHSVVGSKLVDFDTNKQLSAGNHTLQFDLTKHQIANGTYLLTISIDATVHHKKITIM